MPSALHQLYNLIVAKIMQGNWSSESLNNVFKFVLLVRVELGPEIKTAILQKLCFYLWCHTAIWQGVRRR